MLTHFNKFALILSVPSLLFLGWVVYQFYTPPLKFHSVQVLNNPVKAGDNIELSIHRTKNRQCPSTWTAWLLKDNRQIELGKGRVGSAVGVGDDTIIVYWPTKKDVPKGSYPLRSCGVYDCAYRNHFVCQPDGLVVIQ